MVSHRSSSSRRHRSSLWLVLGLLLGLLLVYAIERRNLLHTLAEHLSGNARPEQISSALGNALQVYFTTPVLVYPDKPASRRPPPYETALIADIDSARTSIDLATFEYNLSSVSSALIRAKKRGVAVRLALDRENLEQPEMAAFAGAMQHANIPIHWEETNAFLHSKFVIVDSRLVWMGSWNATNNDTYRNNNNLLRITVPQIVANYAAEFAQMADDRFGRQKQTITPNPRVRVGNITIENYFSPQDGVRQHILERLKAARRSIRFLAFSFTDAQTRDALVAKRKAGLVVQGVFETRNANGTGAAFGKLKSGGVDVVEDGNCYTMHHKVFIIDDRTVITGSYNFTSRAESANDENAIIVDDPMLAQQYIAEFDRVYAQAGEPSRC